MGSHDLTSDAFTDVQRAVSVLLEDTSEAGLDAALAAVPDLATALLDYLGERFVEGAAFADAGEDDPAWWRLLGLLARMAWNDTHHARLCDEVLFNVRGIDAYGWITPLIQNALDPATVELAIVRAAEHTSENVRDNASAATYHLFGSGVAPWTLTDVGQRRLGPFLAQ